MSTPPASPTAPLCWCISKGMAGMNAQTSGLALALGVPYEMHPARLALPWAWLPVPWVPRLLATLRGLGEVSDQAPPRLVISCGRHGVIAALALKRRFADRVFTVHIQDPRVDPAGFDLVVSPKHDAVRGDNVYLTMGAPHYVSDARLADARGSPEAARIASGDRALVTVLLGGRNRYHEFTRETLAPLAAGLERAVAASAVRLVILGSNRTPPEVLQMFAQRFGAEHFVWDGTGSNPYFAALALASHLVVTGDSVSMVSEAAATGQPVFVHHLPERRPAPRFRSFHTMFEQAGITRRFEGQWAHWCYESPNDTLRIAELIREKMGLT
jgi:mitochondrial fission protein ELM1